MTPSSVRCGSDEWMDAAVRAWRARDDDPLDTCHLRRDHRHEHGARVRSPAAGHVATDTPEWDGAKPRAAEAAVGCLHLGQVEFANPVGRRDERVAHRLLERVPRVRHLRAAGVYVRDVDAVDSSCPLTHRDVTTSSAHRRRSRARHPATLIRRPNTASSRRRARVIESRCGETLPFPLRDERAKLHGVELRKLDAHAAPSLRCTAAARRRDAARAPTSSLRSLERCLVGDQTRRRDARFGDLDETVCGHRAARRGDVEHAIREPGRRRQLHRSVETDEHDVQ